MKTSRLNNPGFTALRGALLGLLLLAPTLRASEVFVFIYDYYFLPTNVVVAPGDTVTWINKGGQAHDTTSSEGLWASDLLHNDEELFSFTFPQSGVFPYLCAVHIQDYPEQTGTVTVASINLPPSATILSPTNGTAFSGPTAFTFTVSATDGDGVVTNVGFFINGNLVGLATSPPFTFNVWPLVPGPYTLTAVATDNLGATNLSPAVNITVNPPPQFPLFISVVPINGGTVTASPPAPEGGYDAGTVVTLTASANQGFAFSNWTGAVTSAQNPVTLTMDAAQSVTASFSINQTPIRTLTLATNPASGGFIQITPAPNAANGTYVDGTVVTLTAVPSPGYVFADWSGAVIATTNVITVTMDADKLIAGNFALFTGASFTLTLHTNPPGAGSITVTPAPNGFNGTYFAGTELTLTATATGANEFVGWTGDATNGSNVLIVVMDTNKTVTANFAPIVPPTFTLTLTLSPTNGGVVLATPPLNGGGVYAAGTTVALAAQPAAGFIFVNWTGAITSTNNPLLLVMDGDQALRANFAARPPLNFASLEGSFAGLLLDETETNYTTSGFLSLRVTKTGAYHGTAQVGGIRGSVAGQFDRFGYAPLVFRRGSLSGSLQLEATGGRITGVLTDGRKTPALLLYRTTAAPNGAAFTGDYALTLGAAAPVLNEGRATLRVFSRGRVRVSGTLGDGGTLDDQSFLSPDARVPLFMPLYHGRGLILGWLNVRADGTVQGTVRWFRPGDSRSLNYPHGFSLKIPVTGSRVE